MRTIKFRAWNEEQKYMAYQGTPDLETLQSFIFHFGDKELMQFTGLHDKNGKEIYTGDILQLKRLDGSVLFYKIFCVKGGFAFNAHQDDFYKPQSEIYFYESTSDMQSSSFISSLQIIGNIHEDSCLLEKNQKK